MTKRQRNDTFWSYTDEDNAKYFDDIWEERSENYLLDKRAYVKKNWAGKEKCCWKLMSLKTGNEATTVRSTKPYRLAMIWSVWLEDFWRTPEKRAKVKASLPEATTKYRDHSRHRCGMDWCCNPDHIIIGTRVANEVDKHFHYFLNHNDPSVRKKFRKNFSDLMKEQDVW